MNVFTHAVLRYLLSDVGAVVGDPLKQTCRICLEQCGGDRREAAVALAGKLRQAMEQAFLGKGKQATLAADEQMVRAIVDAGFDRVYWSRVARELLDRLAPPSMRPLVTPSVN